LEPAAKVVGVISTVLLVGASVAKCAEPIQSAGLPLQPLGVGGNKNGGKMRSLRKIRKNYGWLVVCNMAFIFPDVGNVIIPTDFHIFHRGRYTTNQ